MTKAKLAPTPDKATQADHRQAIKLVGTDGLLTEEGMALMTGSINDKAKMEALKDQALRQEVYGRQPQKLDKPGT